MSDASVSTEPASVRRGPRDPAATRQRWIERLQRYQTTELTIAQFCSAEGVSVPAFYQWKRQLAASEAATTQPLAFVPVHVNHSPSSLNHSPSALEVVLPSGALIRFGTDSDPERVAAVLRAVGAIPC